MVEFLVVAAIIFAAAVSWIIGRRQGINDANEFIPFVEDYPPYDEDIIIKTKKNMYFGKLKASSCLYGDYFQPDLTESDERIRVKNIISWRPIINK